MSGRNQECSFPLGAERNSHVSTGPVTVMGNREAEVWELLMEVGVEEEKERWRV